MSANHLKVKQTYQQFSLNTLYTDKRSWGGKACCFAAPRRAGLRGSSKVSVPVMKKKVAYFLFKSCLNVVRVYLIQTQHIIAS